MKTAGKRHYLLQLTVVVEAAEQAVGQGPTEVELLERRLVSAVRRELGEQPEPLGWSTTRFTELDPGHVNCGRCEVCGVWVTDREREEPLAGLPWGARLDGRLLCEDHLPPDHPWAF
jgi:hypothetical protein